MASNDKDSALRHRPKAHPSDSALSRLWVDAVEKVPNGFAANFPPKDEKRDDCSSICPQPIAEVTDESIALRCFPPTYL